MEITEGSSRWIILDRDGVINEDSDAYIKSPEEWRPIPGSLEAISRLSHNGYRVVVATNQSGVGRGLFDIETLVRIHEKMHQMVKEAGGHIESVFYCPHTPEEGCGCRKPNPGLFEEISQRLKIGLEGVPAVGDSLRDLIAARTAGANPILVRTGKGGKTEQDPELPADIPVFDSLDAVATFLISDPQ